jgi:hypothetical protein
LLIFFEFPDLSVKFGGFRESVLDTLQIFAELDPGLLNVREPKEKRMSAFLLLPSCCAYDSMLGATVQPDLAFWFMP